MSTVMLQGNYLQTSSHILTLISIGDRMHPTQKCGDAGKILLSNKVSYLQPLVSVVEVTIDHTSLQHLPMLALLFMPCICSD